MVQTKETLETPDQAIEVMYDPQRHRFAVGFEAEDELLFRLGQRNNCAICLNPANSHDAEGREEIRRTMSFAPAPPQPTVALGDYLNQLKD